MAICSYCKRRKAKRHCPARREELCQLCCGELRQKKINCPPSCPYLKHQNYQEERRWRRLKETQATSFDEEKLAYLATQVEAALHYLAEQNKSLTDRDVLLALEYVREKTNTSQGRLILPGETAGPKSALGEAILKVIDNTRYEKGLVLEVSAQAYTQQEKIICLEAMMKFVLDKARGDLSQRRYLDDLRQRSQKVKKESSQKILLP